MISAISAELASARASPRALRRSRAAGARPAGRSSAPSGTAPCWRATSCALAGADRGQHVSHRAAPRWRSRPASPASPWRRRCRSRRPRAPRRRAGPRRARRRQRGGAVEQHDVAVGPAHAVEHGAQRLGVGLGIGAAQVLEPRARQAGLLGRDLEGARPGRRAARRPGTGPVVVSSSRPSAPCTTQARSEPSCAEHLGERLDPVAARTRRAAGAARRPDWRAGPAG